MRSKNAKEYWKMLKGVSCPKKSNNLNASDFTEYFTAINDPESVFTNQMMILYISMSVIQMANYK